MAWQALGDILAGMGGHPVNRPALDAEVAQGQALNGLRSAQTESAMATARDEQDKALAAEQQAQAMQQLKSVYTQLYIREGHDPDTAAAMADTAATVQQAGQGNFAQTETGLGDAQQQGLRAIIANTDADPRTQFLAAEALAGRIQPGTVAQPVVGQTLPGAAPPTTVVSPLGAAQIAADNANASLHNAQATNPAAFRGGSMVNFSPQQSQEMSTLVSAGILSPSSMYAFARNPSMIDSVFSAYQQDPTGLAGLAHMKQSLATNMAQGQMGRNMVALNTVVGHLNLVPEIATALQNGDVRGLNAIGNSLGMNLTGNTAPVLAQQLSQRLGAESANVLTTTGGTEADRNSLAQAYSSANSPQQLLAAANLSKQLFASRASALEQDYVGQMSVGQPGSEQQYQQDFRHRFMTPATQSALLMGTYGGSAPITIPTPSGAAPTGATVAPAGVGAGAVPGDRAVAPPIGTAAPGVTAVPKVGVGPSGSAAGVATTGPSNAQPGAPPTAQPPMPALPTPTPGMVRNGFTYRGGDPSQQSSWAPVQVPPAVPPPVAPLGSTAPVIQ